MGSSRLTEGTTATSRTRLWLASGWGCQGRRLSRARRNPDTRYGHSLYLPATPGPGRGLNEPEDRSIHLQNLLGGQEFFGTQPPLPFPRPGANGSDLAGTELDDQEIPSRRVGGRPAVGLQA